MRIYLFLILSFSGFLLFSQTYSGLDTLKLQEQIRQAEESGDFKTEFDLVYKLCNQYNGMRKYDSAINEYSKLAAKAKSIGVDSVYYAALHAESYMYFLLKRYSQLDSINSIIFSIEGIDDHYIGSAHFMRGRQLLEEKKFEEGKEDLLKSIDIFVALSDSLRINVSYSTLARLEQDRGNTREAINYFLEALNYYSQGGNERQIVGIYNRLSNLYVDQRNYYKALEYSQSAVDISSKFENQRYVEELRCSHARILIEEDKLDEAEELLKNALNFFQENNYDRFKHKAFNGLSQIHLKRKEYNSAKSMLDSLNNSLIDVTTINERFSFHTMMAEYYKAVNNLSKFKSHIDTCASIIEGTSALRKQRILNSHQYDYFKSRGNTVLALQYLENVLDIKDSLFRTDQMAIVHDLEAQYQKHEQESQIAQLNAENTITGLKLKQQKTISYVSIAGLLIVSLLSYFLFRFYRKLQSQNQIIQKSIEEKDVLLREIHHRVKNNLQFISSLLKLQSRHIDDANALSALKEGQDRVKSMALIHQNLYQEDNLTGVDIKDYFEKLTNNLFRSYNIEPDKILLELAIEDVNLDVDSVIPLGLIVNELMSNALKYAFPGDRSGTIKVILKEKSDILTLTVKDNGVGIGIDKHDKLNSSFGYRLINAFKNQLDAEIDIVSENGTSVSLNIKDYTKVA